MTVISAGPVISVAVAVIEGVDTVTSVRALFVEAMAIAPASPFSAVRIVSV